MESHRATKTTATGPRQHPLIVMLMLGAFLSESQAFGQAGQMRFFPVRSAPLGSPPGTVGDPVTPEFNSALGCWEVKVEPGVEVDLDLQAFGWGNAPGNPELGAIQATVDATSYNNGFGGDLNPKGWPATPLDGAYQATRVCKIGGDGSPCAAPFDETCAGGSNGFCIPNDQWVISSSCDDEFEVAAVFTNTMDYIWAAVGVSAFAPCSVDDGTVKTTGGLILEVPIDAAGTYVIALDPDPNTTFMTASDGTDLPSTRTSACITILEPGRCCSDLGCQDGVTEVECPEPSSFAVGETCDGLCPCPGSCLPGRCCFHIGPEGGVCEDDVSEQNCAMRPGTTLFSVGETCDGEDACPTCLSDSDCLIFTELFCVYVDGCDEFGQCRYPPSYNVDVECCDPGTGWLTELDDGDDCTTDTCDTNTGQVSHTHIPGCMTIEADASSKNRYVSFETGVLTVATAYHVRLTASALFPESVGDLGWVGAPDSEGTALVVPNRLTLASWPGNVRVGDCEVVPAATYEIRATADGVNFDTPIVIETTPRPGIKFWGDIVGDFDGVVWTPPNGVQNFSDVQAAIKTYQGAESTAPLIWADVEPESPNRVANFNDVLQLVLAFGGQPYPFADPADCP